MHGVFSGRDALAIPRLAGRRRSALAASGLDFDFTTGALDPRIAFTRPSQGWRFDASGLYVPEAINAPRFDYDPVTLQIGGLLYEPQRTNLLTYTRSFTTNWTIYDGIALAANDAAAPDGTMTATRATEPASGFPTLINNPVNVGANASTAGGIYVKPGPGVTWMRLIVADDHAATHAMRAWFDVSSGVKGTIVNGGTATGGSLFMENVGNGWWRISIAGIASTGTADRCIWINSAVGDGNSARVSSGSYWIWGAQLETGTAPTSLIPTFDAAQVTRSADQATFTIPAGVATLRYTFDDDTTQDLSVTPGASYTIPTDLSRRHIKRIASL